MSLRIVAGLSFGYLFPQKSLDEAMSLGADAIVAQGTSSDVGPTYYGSGKPHFPDRNIRTALEMLLLAARRADIPFVMSLGSAGSDVHLERVLRIVDEIAVDNGIRFKASVLHGEIEKNFVRSRLAAGVPITRLVETEYLSETLTDEDVDRSVAVLGQMGPEPIIEALGGDIDGVFTGRSLDSGLFMALPMMNGVDRGVAAHFGMVMACGALAATPGSIDLLYGTIDNDGFVVAPPNPRLACTPLSVAAHGLYEQPNPVLENLPGGQLDLSDVRFEAVDERTVRVTGSRWITRDPYTIKIEGVERLGSRSICLAGVRDVNLIACLDDVFADIRRKVEQRLGDIADSALVDFKVYGRDAVLREWEPIEEPHPHEVGVVIDVVARDQETASAVCGLARSELLLNDYPGRTSTSGNVAFPFSPHEVEMGDTYTFRIWHELPVEDPVEPFRAEIREFGG
ncbi:MAG: acyclic terpene utilization AtuA family protein [Gaiellaceae bacterium]